MKPIYISHYLNAIPDPVFYGASALVMLLFLATPLLEWWDWKHNWTVVGAKDGWVYYQHRKQRKRRARHQGQRPNSDFLNFKTDDL